VNVSGPSASSAIHEQPAGREAAEHRRPRLVRLLLRVLPQDVERPQQHRPGPGQLEPAPAELQPRRVGRRLARGDPVGVQLQPEHAHVRAHGTQARGHLDRGHGRGAVAEVHHERVGRGVQGVDDQRRADHPAVDPPQPVRVGGAPGGQAERARPAGG